MDTQSDLQDVIRGLNDAVGRAQSAVHSALARLGPREQHVLEHTFFHGQDDQQIMEAIELANAKELSSLRGQALEQLAGELREAGSEKATPEGAAQLLEASGRRMREQAALRGSQEEAKRMRLEMEAKLARQSTQGRHIEAAIAQDSRVKEATDIQQRRLSVILLVNALAARRLQTRRWSRHGALGDAGEGKSIAKPQEDADAVMRAARDVVDRNSDEYGYALTVDLEGGESLQLSFDPSTESLLVLELTGASGHSISDYVISITTEDETPVLKARAKGGTARIPIARLTQALPEGLHFKIAY